MRLCHFIYVPQTFGRLHVHIKVSCNIQDAVLVWSKVGGDYLPTRAQARGPFLTITDVQPEDAGQYRCTLKRWSGNVLFRTKDVTLKVERPLGAACILFGVKVFCGARLHINTINCLTI